MPSELITLETSSNIILCPLYFLSMFQEFVVCFAITEEDEETFEYRHICCLRPDPLVFEPRPERPVLFELIGQIATRDCWLTALGVENNQDPDDPFASCWVEARPDDISRIYWRSVLPTVEAIINVIPGNVDSTKLISVGRPGAVGTVRLQVIWRPQEGKVSELVGATLCCSFISYNAPF